MTMLPFDNQRDEELGRLLREQLTGPAPEAFLGRLRMAVSEAGPPGYSEVLAGWARPRMMALAIAAGLLVWLGAWFSVQQGPSDAGITMASLPVHSVVNPQPPRTDEIMGALLGGR